jgi:hypothetical protein
MGLLGSRQQNETAAFHPFDFALRNAKLGRIDEVIR